MEDVIRLPDTENTVVDRAAAKKRKLAMKFDPQKEAEKRRVNVKKVCVLGEDDSSIKLLEDLVFGAEDELVENIVQDKRQKHSLLLDDDKDDGHGSSESETETESRLRVPTFRKPAWEDDDDEHEEEVDMTHRFRKDLTKGTAEATMTKQKLQQRMKDQFQKAMGGAPSWAETKVTKKKAEEDDEDDDLDEEDESLLRTTGNYVVSSDSLPSGILRMKRCLNANNSQPSDSKLTTVQFHPSAQVIMTAGLDQAISLFQVDGKTNPKIQSINLERFPIHKAQFTTDGEKVVATSLTNKMFYIYDMMEGQVVPVMTVRGLNEAKVKEFSVSPEGDSLLLTGTRGYLHVLTLKTKEVVRSMKINGNIAGVAFNRDGSKIYTHSEEGEVYVWDSRSSRCLNRFTDEGCVHGTSIAASRNGQYPACGSQSGVVNVYSQEACQGSANPKPLKAVKNLLTTATSLTFNPSSEILAMASSAEDEAVKLIHLASLTAFSNFPVANRKVVHRVSCFDFSPNSGFFSLANNKGVAPLYRLLHYKDF